MVVADNEVGFIAGLCVARTWVGDPARRLDPWRDTGVEIRGPAVAEIERAFARTWALIGAPLTDPIVPPAPVGDVNVRVVQSEPATAGMLRLDELVAALARRKLWLTDAYFNGTTSYVQALRAAAKDGVDVRLLIPNATDIPALSCRPGPPPMLAATIPMRKPTTTPPPMGPPTSIRHCPGRRCCSP